MSCTSPLTVAITILPLLSGFLSLSTIAFLISSNAACATAADIISCGRKIVPFSKSTPILSSAGISMLLTISIESVVSSICLVSCAPSLLSPLRTAWYKGLALIGSSEFAPWLLTCASVTAFVLAAGLIFVTFGILA